jgi:predicted RNase H-like HicB family nuclease
MARIPELPGVFSHARTREEARAMVCDALREMLFAWAQTGATTPVTVPARADSVSLDLVIAP